ncbi:MAG TPA: MFS transporter [Roseiflexaceae bacterium]|nr:MFS transporter [Roseiflexaceae bacterium]
MLATLRQRNFALLWFGGLISFAGDWALIIALPVFVYDLTGSTLATGAMFIAQTLPRLLFGPLAGVLVDRWDRKRTLVVVNLAQAVVLPLLLLVQSADMLWLLYLVACVQTSVSLFVHPAERALVPRLVGEERLLPANSLLAFSWELTRLVAPPLGGLLMGLLGLTSIVLFDSISFLLAAILLALIAMPPAAQQDRPVDRGPAGIAAIWEELVAGLRYARYDRLVSALFVIVGTSMISEGIANVLGFPWLKETLHGGALERGWLASAQAVGGVIGGLAIGRVAQRIQPVALMTASGVLLGVASMALININLFPVPPALVMPLALVLKAAQGAPIICFYVSLETLLQQSAPDRYRGRIFGAYGAVCALAMLAGQAIASFLGDQLGVVVVMNGVGALFLAAGLLALALLRGLGIAHFVSPSSVAVTADPA